MTGGVKPRTPILIIKSISFLIHRGAGCGRSARTPVAPQSGAKYTVRCMHQAPAPLYDKTSCKTLDNIFVLIYNKAMIKDKFEDVFTLENLYKAHRRGRLGKREKRQVVLYEIDLMQNLKKMQERILSGKYRVSRYHEFVIYEPKKRQIQTLLYRDRVVQHVLCDNLFAPYFTRRAILDNGVCQVGKGTHFTIDRLVENTAKLIRKEKTTDLYVLKCDILKYFPSIPHKQLKEKILHHIDDKKLRDFVTMIIDSYHTAPSYLTEYNIPIVEACGPHPFNASFVTTGRGLPIGNQTSQVFGMFYLDTLDRFIKEKLRVKCYSRYMDDFILVHPDKAFLKRALKQIQALLDELGLQLNDKTKIFPLKHGITYLGFKLFFYPNGTCVRKVVRKTVKRFIAKAKLINYAFAHNLIKIPRIQSTLASYHGHLKHGNCRRLEVKLFKLIKINEIYLQQKELSDGK